MSLQWHHSLVPGLVCEGAKATALPLHMGLDWRDNLLPQVHTQQVLHKYVHGVWCIWWDAGILISFSYLKEWSNCKTKTTRAHTDYKRCDSTFEILIQRPGPRDEPNERFTLYLFCFSSSYHRYFNYEHLWFQILQTFTRCSLSGCPPVYQNHLGYLLKCIPGVMPTGEEPGVFVLAHSPTDYSNIRGLQTTLAQQL